MRSLPRSQWPDWIRERIGGSKNVVVKEKSGNFYLYGHRSFWDKDLKRTRTRTRYLGSLKRSGGRMREHGHVALVYSLLEEHGITKALERSFPHAWKDILVFSMSRVICPSPLKRTGSWADKTTLPGRLGIEPASGKRLSRMLSVIGKEAEAQADFMRGLMRDGELLLYDGSVIYSASGYNKLLEIGYNKDRLFVPKANVTLLFSRDRNVPLRFRVFFGSVNEIKTMRSVLAEMSGRDVMFIADKGYHSKGLHDELDGAGAGFVMPIPRSDRRIDYGKGLPEVFMYNKRIIRGARCVAGDYWLYLYEDQLLKYTETTQYYVMRISGKEAGGRRRIAYREEWAGRIALLSNRKLGTEEAYLLWKTRGRIEKSFDVLQNLLDTDHPYVSDEYTFRGYMFASFVSLIAYYLLLNLLQKHGVNGKVSVSDLMFELSKVMVEEGKVPALAEIPAKVEKLARSIGVWDILVKMGES